MLTSSVTPQACVVLSWVFVCGVQDANVVSETRPCAVFVHLLSACSQSTVSLLVCVCVCILRQKCN